MSTLTPEQLEHFRERLETLRDELTERLRLSVDSARPVDLAQPIGRLARVDAMQVQQMAKMQRRRDEGQVQMISSALARIRAGTYGECTRCEETIELQRLEVSPETPFCLSCRRQTESR